jgi:hypothetical protein
VGRGGVAEQAYVKAESESRDSTLLTPEFLTFLPAGVVAPKQLPVRRCGRATKGPVVPDIAEGSRGARTPPRTVPGDDDHESVEEDDSSVENDEAGSLKDEVERTVRQLMAQEKAAVSGTIQVEEVFRHQCECNLNGQAAGVKPGEIGSLVHPEAAAHECYCGCPNHDFQIKLVLSGTGLKTINSSTGLLGSTPENRALTTGFFLSDSGALESRKVTHGIPILATLRRWMNTRVIIVEGCLEGHARFKKISAAGSAVVTVNLKLILARYHFLRVLIEVLVESEGVPWPAVWRYAERFSLVNFVELCGGTPLSRSLLEVIDTPVWIRSEHMRNVFRQYRDPKLLTDAIQDHVRFSGENRSPAPLAAPVGNPGQSGSGIPSGRKKKCCPLCLSTEHKYLYGNYGHTGPITQPCPQRQSDGAVCGKRHAFSGDLRSLCRLRSNARPGEE